MKNIHIPLKGEYAAKNVISKLKYSGTSKIPFALQLITPKGSQQLWDLNSFRPDIRDFPDIMSKMKDGVHITVLYENLIVGDNTRTKIPRYILYSEYDKVKYFVNVR